jgi:hypothetical protein
VGYPLLSLPGSGREIKNGKLKIKNWGRMENEKRVVRKE